MGKQEQNTTNELLQYIKTKEGYIYHVLGHDSKPNEVMLRTGNSYIKKSFLSIKQGLADGKYSAINIHELNKWKKEDRIYLDMLNLKMFKRIVLSQLLMELDDELIEHYQDNKYFRSLLDRTNKETERLVSKQYNDLYNYDKEILHNLMNEVDNLTSKCAKVDIQDFPHLNIYLDKYLDDPKKHQSEKIQFTRID
jgi:hypothetical protein